MINKSNKSDLLFEVLTPLNFTVRVTYEYWNLISSIKHPVMADQENIVKETLTNPDEIRLSKKDDSVYMFYKSQYVGRWVSAVARKLNGDGFLITAYPTDAIKEGKKNMDKVKVFYDQTGNTLTVWFGNPQDEYLCQETGEEIILIKNKLGEVIGFEKLNFIVTDSTNLQVDFQTSSAIKYKLMISNAE